jgi:hypothetical protein
MDQRPTRSTKAIELLSHLDSVHLVPDDLLVAIDMFNADATCAATYLAMETSNVMSRAWLQRELMRLNLTRLNLPSSMYPTLDQPSSSEFPSGSF